LHFIKDGPTLEVHINAVEATYSVQEPWDVGNKTFTDNMTVGARSSGSNAAEMELSWFAIYRDAISQARRTTNHGLGLDMGLIGTNVGDAMSLTSFIGLWDTAGIKIFLPFTAWSKGNGTVDQNTLEMPSYPDGAFDATFLNMSSSFGYKFNSRDGKCDFERASNSNIGTIYNVPYTDISKFTWEKIIIFTTGIGIQTFFGQEDDGSNFVRAYTSNLEKLTLDFMSGGVLKRAQSIETVSNGRHHIAFVKDGATPRIYLDGTEVTYGNQQTYNLGTFSLTNNLRIGVMEVIGQGFDGDAKLDAVYNTALSSATIAVNAGLDNAYGLVGTNVSDQMNLAVAPVGVNIPALQNLIYQ